MNGYDNGIDTSWTGEDDTEANTSWLASPYTGQTCTLTIANTNPADLSTVAGFNLQLESLPADMYIAITDITLYKADGEGPDVPSPTPDVPDDPGDGSTVYTNCGTAPITNQGWTDCQFLPLSEDVVIKPTDKVEIVFSAVDEDGEAITDLSLSFELATDGADVYNSRVAVGLGQDPVTGEYAWGKPSGENQVCYNALEEEVTVKGYMMQAASASSSAIPGSTITVNIDKIIITPAE